jgi:hypothetical protein
MKEQTPLPITRTESQKRLPLPVAITPSIFTMTVAISAGPCFITTVTIKRK